MTVPPQVDTRDCALYRFWVRHPVTGRRVLGYVGETARMPFVRLMEHIYQQPWADTILAWEIDPVTYAGKDAVLAAERATVERERPLYNVEFNRGNPDRIRPWEAVRQRQAREPGWQPPAKTPLPRPRGGARPRVAVLPLARDRWAMVSRVLRWLPVATLSGWVTVVAASGPVATWYDGIAYGAAVTCTAVGLSLPGKRRRRGRR